MTMAELEGDLLSQELVLEAFMYDVRNCVEYLAHPCVAIGLHLMGADPWEMLLAWCFGTCVEIVTDLLGTQCKRLVSTCAVGTYTMRWNVVFVSMAVLMAMSVTNTSCIQSVVTLQWSC